jgi:predicted phosphodiesterase
MHVSTITWVHLSDLHFREGVLQVWEQDIVLKSLLVDLESHMVKSGIKPDFILVSGDITFSGQPAEYDLAGKFFDELLKTTNLSRQRLFLVPGNHDVHRDSVSPVAKTIAASLASKKSKEEYRKFLHSVWNSDQDRSLALQRLTFYNEFVQDYLADCPSDVDTESFTVSNLSIAGKRVAILRLNSAWLCFGGSDERNKVVVGESQVRAAIEQSEDADLRIAMLHHPFDWLHDLDREEVEALLMQHCTFILHGHLHRLGMAQIRTPDTDTIVVAAGASYEGRTETNAYNLVQLNLTDGTGKIILRRYSDERGGFWAKDVQSYRNVDDGEYRFPLSDGLRLQQEGIEPELPGLSDLANWPPSQGSKSSQDPILVRAGFIEARLCDIIDALSSEDQAQHAVIGRIRNRANYLVQNDSVRIKELASKGSSPSTVWRMLRSLEDDVGSLSEEFLDYITGVVLGQKEIGREICRFSDALLDEVGTQTGEGWSGTTVLADRDIPGPASHLVRLPFPNEDIWSLPFAVQQYAALMSITSRLATLMSFVKPGDSLWSVLAADMLATHFAGPAYGFAASASWFSPWHSPGTEHGESSPLSDLRFYFILKVLEHCGDLYAREIEVMRQTWPAERVGDERPNSQQGGQWAEYEAYADELHKQVILLRYGAAVSHVKRKRSARYLVSCYEQRKGVEGLEQVALVDVLNAAWYSRMQSTRPSEVPAMRAFYGDLFRAKAARMG